MLSHASQKARIHRIMKDRKNLNAKPDKYSKLCISLTDEQDSELSAVVSMINKSQSMRSELDEVFLQADKDKEGHGAVLQDIWELDSADKQFSEDQQRNSCVCEVHVCVQILLIDVCISTNAHAPNPSPPPPPPPPHPSPLDTHTLSHRDREPHKLVESNYIQISFGSVCTFTSCVRRTKKFWSIAVAI